MNSFSKWLAASLLLFLVACKDKNSQVTPPAHDYFPLENGAKLTYSWTLLLDTITDPNSLASDTIIWNHDDINNGSGSLTLHVEKDTLIKNKLYKKITNNRQLNHHLVRKENGAYFELLLDAEVRHALIDTAETLFLKDNLKTGDTWQSNNQHFTVVAVHDEYSLHSRRYKNVIRIRKELFTADTISWSAYYMYADGVGEIYSHLPSPASELYVSTESKLAEVR